MPDLFGERPDTAAHELPSQPPNEDAIREDIYNALMQPLGDEFERSGYTGTQRTAFIAGFLSGRLTASKIVIADDEKWLELGKARSAAFMAEVRALSEQGASDDVPCDASCLDVHGKAAPDGD